MISPSVSIKPYHHSGDTVLNEVEIYYDKYFNPYYYTSDIHNNYTNVTNEYNNDTYLNKTYENHTKQNITYLNKTYQNETYTGPIYRNITYVNLTNRTGGTTFLNTSHIYHNRTSLNASVLLAENKRLSDKIDRVLKRFNETDDTEISADKKESGTGETYLNGLLIVLLIGILVFQVAIFINRKRKRAETTDEPEDPALEPEVEYTPKPGFTSEGEKDIISRKVKERATRQQELRAQPQPESEPPQHAEHSQSMQSPQPPKPPRNISTPISSPEQKAVRVHLPETRETAPTTPTPPDPPQEAVPEQRLLPEKK